MKKYALLTLLMAWFYGHGLLTGQNLDPLFNPQIRTFEPPGRMAIQSDDKVLASGRFSFASGQPVSGGFVRLLPDGNLDTTFQLSESVQGPIHEWILGAEGKILLTGHFTHPDGSFLANVLRLLPDGSLDTTFTAPADPEMYFYELAMLPNEKIFVLAWYFDPLGQLFVFPKLLHIDGTVDTLFKGPILPWETGRNSNLTGVHVQSEDALLISGRNLLIDTLVRNVYRLDAATGEVDVDFNPPFPANPNFQIDESGRFGLLRSGQRFEFLDRDGQLLKQVTMNFSGGKLARFGDEGFIVLSENGSALLTDTSTRFFDPVIVEGSMYNLGKRTDGSLIAGGNFMRTDGVFTPGIVRLQFDQATENLIVDRDFAGRFFSLGRVWAIEPLEDGRILIGGLFNAVNGRGVNNIARLMPDGSLDTTFNASLTNRFDPVVCLAELRNDRYATGSYIGGSSSPYLNGLNILEQNGYKVTEYDLSIKSYGVMVTFLEVDRKGHMYVSTAGYYDEWNLEYANNLIKIDSTGQELFNFREADSKNRLTMTGLAITPDNQLIIAGDEIVYDGSAPTPMLKFSSLGIPQKTFQPELPPDIYLSDLLLLKNGDLLVGNTGYGGYPRTLYRLKPSGALDPDFYFGNGGCPDGTEPGIEWMVELNDGNLLLSLRCAEGRTLGVEGQIVLIDRNGHHLQDILPLSGRIGEALERAVVVGNTVYISGVFFGEQEPKALLRLEFPTPSALDEKTDETIGQVQIFPNPVGSGKLFLQLDEVLIGKPGTYQISGINGGEILKSGSLTGYPQPWVNIDDLPSGVFVLRIQVSDVFKVLKFIKL